MKVGDLVRQCDRLVKFKGTGPPKRSKLVGIVLEIHELDERLRTHPSGDWIEVLGRGITVLWSNGKVMKNFAEKSLEVISEGGGFNYFQTRTSWRELGRQNRYSVIQASQC